MFHARINYLHLFFRQRVRRVRLRRFLRLYFRQHDREFERYDPFSCRRLVCNLPQLLWVIVCKCQHFIRPLQILMDQTVLLCIEFHSADVVLLNDLWIPPVR